MGILHSVWIGDPTINILSDLPVQTASWCVCNQGTSRFDMLLCIIPTLYNIIAVLWPVLCRRAGNFSSMPLRGRQSSAGKEWSKSSQSVSAQLQPSGVDLTVRRDYMEFSSNN